MELLTKESIEDFEKDISPTRRRSKIINHVFGSSAKWSSLLVSVVFPLFVYHTKYGLPLLLTFKFNCFEFAFWDKTKIT